MIPYIQKGDLAKLHPNRQNKICICPEKCKHFYTFSDDKQDFILCESETKEFGFSILHELGLVTEKLAFPKSKYGWTTEQERFIKKYLSENPVKYGTYSLLGEMLGKSRGQVKSKVQHMRKEGKLNRN